VATDEALASVVRSVVPTVVPTIAVELVASLPPAAAGGLERLVGGVHCRLEARAECGDLRVAPSLGVGGLGVYRGL